MSAYVYHYSLVIVNFTTCFQNQDHSSPQAIATCQEYSPSHSITTYKKNNYTYKIGNSRALTIGKNNIIQIRYKGTKSAVIFMYNCWASFILVMGKIDYQLYKQAQIENFNV